MSEEYYSLLDINKNASQEDIKKAYRKKALKHHPDRNPDNREQNEQIFKKISEAYDVLSNDEKRKIYDQYGKEGVKNMGNGGGGNPFDAFNVFESFFGGGSPFGGGMPGGPGGPFGGNFSFNMDSEQSHDRMEHVNVDLECELEDFYCGNHKHLSFKRTLLCPKCNGSGADNPNDVEMCVACEGKGRITQIRQIGPGMITQSNSICGKCKGKGRTIRRGAECKVCGGKKKIIKEENINLPIQKGTESSTKAQINDLGNEYNNGQKSSLIIQFIEKKHKQYTRKGNDLYMKQNITLSEALTGTEFIVEKLNKQTILIKTKSNQIITPQHNIKVKGLGMPIHGSNNYGDLYIEINIVFPTNISEKRQEYIKKILGHSDHSVENNSEIVKFELIQKENINFDPPPKKQQQRRNNQGEGVECAQQ